MRRGTGSDIIIIDEQAEFTCPSCGNKCTFDTEKANNPNNLSMVKIFTKEKHTWNKIVACKECIDRHNTHERWKRAWNLFLFCKLSNFKLLPLEIILLIAEYLCDSEMIPLKECLHCKQLVWLFKSDYYHINENECKWKNHQHIDPEIFYKEIAPILGFTF